MLQRLSTGLGSISEMRGILEWCLYPPVERTVPPGASGLDLSVTRRLIVIVKACHDFIFAQTIGPCSPESCLFQHGFGG
jgi:hypothetical protein